ncbi:MAG: threonine synthase [Thermoanaerobaculia bacterium]|nr:threonine synthase [Thermoanaerobaculia bacterium]
MELTNLLDAEDRADFRSAARRGIGRGGGLYFPTDITPLPNVPELLAMGFVERSVAIAQALLAGEFPPDTIRRLVTRALDFPVPLVAVGAESGVLELFHGPTLAFKDFGARFLAEVLAELAEPARPLTILTATSGDTGAAVAHAFHGRPGVSAVVLFPRGRIAPLQEKLFSTLGGNVHTFAVEGDFDACQALVKQAFADTELTARLGLNSANSINLARLLAQVFYYFEAAARAPRGVRRLVAVPSGNFGNVTAGLWARALGAPLDRFVAVTNANDTVPRYLATGDWSVRPTVATLSNAMDVSAPNNWPRTARLIAGEPGVLAAETISEAATGAALVQLDRDFGYLADPHTAVAWAGLERARRPGEFGIFLATAHPAKFQATVEALLGRPVPLPPALAAVADLPSGAVPLAADFPAFRRALLALDL